MIQMSEQTWKPPIVETIAVKGEGIDELWAAIEKHRAHQEEKGELGERRRRRIRREIKEIVSERYRHRVEEECTVLLEKLTDEVSARRIDPYAAAERLISGLEKA
jgi:LAO/AO transport system kinase